MSSGKKAFIILGVLMLLAIAFFSFIFGEGEKSCKKYGTEWKYKGGYNDFCVNQLTG